MEKRSHLTRFNLSIKGSYNKFIKNLRLIHDFYHNKRQICLLYLLEIYTKPKPYYHEKKTQLFSYHENSVAYMYGTINFSVLQKK